MMVHDDDTNRWWWIVLKRMEWTIRTTRNSCRDQTWRRTRRSEGVTFYDALGPQRNLLSVLIQHTFKTRSHVPRNLELYPLALQQSTIDFFKKRFFHYFSFTSLPTKHIKHFGLRTKYIGPFTHGTQQTNDFIMNFPFPKRHDHRFQTNSFWDTSR